MFIDVVQKERIEW